MQLRWEECFIRKRGRAMSDKKETNGSILKFRLGNADVQISLLLGELHIAGKIEWRAFDQAEYVWKMNKVFGKTYDFLATHLRWSRSKLSQKISAYEETKAYLERTGDPQGINRFSHFEEFMKKKPLRDRREQDPSFMEQFGKWVQDGKFPDSRD